MSPTLQFNDTFLFENDGLAIVIYIHYILSVMLKFEISNYGTVGFVNNYPKS